MYTTAEGKMRMLKNKSKQNIREQMTMKNHHKIQVPRPAQPLEPESDTDVEEETLSLPEFHFIDFAGLEGFDKESCSWTPVNCEEYEYPPSSYDGDNNHSDFDQHVRFDNSNTSVNNSSNNKVSAKKTISGPCNMDHRRRGRNSHNSFHLPRLPGTKRTTSPLSGQNHRGGLIYDEQPLKIRSRNFNNIINTKNICDMTDNYSNNNNNHNNGDDTEEDSLQRNLDRIRIFGGGPRNCNSRLYKDRQNSISLPPLHGNLRRSSSLPCQGNDSEQQSKGRKAFLDLHKKSIRMYRDYHQNVSLNNNNTKIPWQGPNSKGIYSTNNSNSSSGKNRFHCEFSSSENGKSQGKRYGGLGIVTCNNASNTNNSRSSGRKESGNFPRTYKANKSVNNNNNSSSSNIFNMSGKILFPPCKPGPFLKASKTKHAKGIKS